jgi:hypothetical protein
MSRRPIFIFPIAALLVLLSVYLAFTLMQMLAGWTWSLALIRSDLRGPRGVFFSFALIAGILRVSQYHPWYREKYSRWLMSTPWRPPLALPLGPVHLVWEDLLFLLPSALLAALDADLPWFLPVACYLIGFGFAGAVVVQCSNKRWFLIALVLLWSLVLLCHALTVLVIALMVAVGAVANAAITDSLAHFPWDIGDSMRDGKRHPQAGLAWPLNRVGPVIIWKPISPAVGWISAGLCGWWTFVVLTISRGDTLAQMVMVSDLKTMLPAFCLTAMLLRIIPYCTVNWAPIGIVGRVATGHLIIPGYDRVFVAPLLMGAMAFLCPYVVEHLPPPVAGALVVTIVMAIGLNARPTIRAWQLTGHHRIIAGSVREPTASKQRTGR